jgi:CHAD domain-containing protein
MRDFVKEQTSTLLRRLAYQVTRSRKNADEEQVHDLRVAIRRLNRCLQTFADFYPAHARKKIRRRLNEMMDGAAEVRDRDIAAALLTSAGAPPDSAPLRLLKQERTHAAKHLSGILDHWKQNNLSRRWREELGL